MVTLVYLLSPEGADSLTEELDSLSTSAHKLFDGLHFADAAESWWDKVVELGPILTDGLFRHAMELYPSDKITEFKASVVNVTTTATTLHQVVLEAAEQHGIPLDTMKGELGDICNSMFEELKEQFPPPDEAPSHENRMVMISTALDRIEGGFLQFAINHGVSEEPLKSHSGSLKLHAQSIVVTIGDLVERHPDLAITLLVAAITMLLPELWLLRQVLRMFGFGPRGPIKGGVAAWLQRWLFGPAVPKGGWFATLQYLAMQAVKL
ncbi:hypothetical protein K503DRAFT_765709 [Rhizopogon vinicolor AM-OR11-026]|uniref:Uncharacterized protein n=1 Tax=Rhizopogon vinicolor AM-OR11-026 TaxID=1314800 RepID=A0A1B7NFQ5_9AGAM|nr:hypothetical protein K503DRAFT_765709 [Rhizopogon vinicolor AM-OR11-026]